MTLCAEVIIMWPCRIQILGNISVRPMPDKCLEEAVSQHLQASGKTLASLRPNVTVRYCPQPLLVIVGVDNAVRWTTPDWIGGGGCDGPPAKNLIRSLL